MSQDMMSLTASTQNMDFKATNACLNDWYQPLCNTVYHYYPSYQQFWNQPSKIEQAFKVVQKLIAKDLLELKTVKQFIEAVSEIAECL